MGEILADAFHSYLYIQLFMLMPSCCFELFHSLFVFAFETLFVSAFIRKNLAAVVNSEIKKELDKFFRNWIFYCRLCLYVGTNVVEFWGWLLVFKAVPNVLAACALIACKLWPFFFFFLRSPAISLGFTTFGWDFCVCDRFSIQPLR